MRVEMTPASHPDLMSSPLILVTGATGYIASLLIPRLLQGGYRVRALARQPERLKARAWYSQVDIARGDVMDKKSLRTALEGVHTAYYLVHNMAFGHGYTSIEIEGAQNFSETAGQAGVKQLIYLGGLADPEQHIAPHMRSRIETGMTLRQGSVPVTEFRAGVITGSGSISFEMIRFMAELLPVVPGPLWLKNKSQPIAVQNVIDYLLAALTNPNGRGKVYEIGVPRVYTFLELMKIYAVIRGHRRWFILIPFVPVWLMALAVNWMTPVPRRIAHALIGGLSSDSLVLDRGAQDAFPEVQLMEYESAVREAMKRLHPLAIEHVWEDGECSQVKSLKHEGFFIEHREKCFNAPSEAVIAAIKKLHAADEHLLTFRKLPFGEEWVQWQVKGSCLLQTAYFAPFGLGGFLYWYLLRPFHAYRFWRSLETISGTIL